MRLSIDTEAEALYLKLREGKVGSSKEVWDGVVLDLDEAGEVLGVEILWLSRRTPLEARETLSLELPLPTATLDAKRDGDDVVYEHRWKQLLEHTIVADLKRLTGDSRIVLRPLKKSPTGYALDCAPHGPRGGKVLAFLGEEHKWERLGIQVKAELIEKAGVAHLMDEPQPEGYYGQPAYGKWVSCSGDKFVEPGYNQTLDILVKVWQACHNR